MNPSRSRIVRWLTIVLVAMVGLLILSASVLWLVYGRAAPYAGPDVATGPGAAADVLVELPLPPGNVAVAAMAASL